VNTKTHHLLAAATLGLALGASGHAQAGPPPGHKPPTSRVIAPLLDDEGEPMAADPRAIPADPALHTRSGLYATEAQARMLEAALHDRVIAVRAGCCGAHAIERAVNQAWTRRAASDSPADIAVVVRGASLRRAARAADRLTDAGLSRVWLVSAP